MTEFGKGMKFLQVVIIILLQSVAHHAVALSMYTQFSQRDSRALSNQNSTECPSVWFEVTHDCKCIDHLFLNCEGESVYADMNHILGGGFYYRFIGETKHSILRSLIYYTKLHS